MDKSEVSLMANNVKTPRSVLRGVNSQKNSQVGVHWLRISIPRQYLEQLRSYVDLFFGKSGSDGYGLWSYDTRWHWPCGASLNYDRDIERSDSVHQGKATLDCPGGCLDELASDDLHTFMVGLAYFQPTCSRIDVFFDDFTRLVTPSDLHEIIKRKDYTGFKITSIKQSFSGETMIRDEVDFGLRGQNGSGKYLRVYDKELESDGEKDCIRYEVEFTKEKAKEVFIKMLQTEGNLQGFATLCGALVGGAVCFVRRTGEKNIDRLELHEFWQIIIDMIGNMSIRVRRENTDLGDMVKWVDLQISPTLACIRKTYDDDEDFLDWFFNLLSSGEERLSGKHENILSRYKHGFRRDRGSDSYVAC